MLKRLRLKLILLCLANTCCNVIVPSLNLLLPAFKFKSKINEKHTFKCQIEQMQTVKNTLLAVSDKTGGTDVKHQHSQNTTLGN